MPRQSMARASSATTRGSRVSTVRDSRDEMAIGEVDIAALEDRPDSALRTQICGIFGDAQKSTVGHRKLATRLRKVQESCVFEPPTATSPREGDFGAEFSRCVLRLLHVKRTETVADRVIAFIGVFLELASESGGSRNNFGLQDTDYRRTISRQRCCS